jgi:hypothetical protein
MLGTLTQKEQDVVRFTRAIEGAYRRLEAAKLIKASPEVERISKEIKDLEGRRERAAGQGL